MTPVSQLLGADHAVFLGNVIGMVRAYSPAAVRVEYHRADDGPALADDELVPDGVPIRWSVTLDYGRVYARGRPPRDRVIVRELVVPPGGDHRGAISELTLEALRVAEPV